MTSTDDLETKLSQIKPKTLSARLKPWWPAIEEKIAEGIEHQAIVEILQSSGFEDLELGTFRRYLTRYREKAGTVHKRGAGSPAAPGRTATRATPADGNSQLTGDDESRMADEAEKPVLEDILNARNRDNITDKYATKQKPLFKKK
jgi:hypothetical protein